jgi:hypothetical protein
MLDVRPVEPDPAPAAVTAKTTLMEEAASGLGRSAHTFRPNIAVRVHGAAIVNSGCWLRQLHAVPARLGLPPVFVSRFVQTHVRVSRAAGQTQVELWEHPRPSQQRTRSIERLAILGRFPAQPATRSPHIRRQIWL